MGRLQIRQIQYVADRYRSLGALLSSPVKQKLAEVLLAASTFSDHSWKHKALQTVDTMMAGEPTDYLQIWADVRKCTLTGLQIGYEVEEWAIRKITPTDARSNALYGQLILSYVNNNIRRNNLDHPRSVLGRISPLNIDCPSTMERLVLKKQYIAIGRIERYLGNFLTAQEYLTPPVDEDIKLDAVTGRYRISHLASVLCELNQADKARRLLLEEINVLEELGLQNISSCRCLRLSLAEANLLQGNLPEAEKTYLSVKVAKDCADLTIVTAIEKLRLWMGLARISHLRGLWSQALANWEKALRASDDCDWKACFNQVVIWYSISHVKLVLGERETSMRYIQEADEMYGRVGCKYWLTGLATHWLEYIWGLLGHVPPHPSGIA